jgi:hypothetical protein
MWQDKWDSLTFVSGNADAHAGLLRMLMLVLLMLVLILTRGGCE